MALNNLLARRLLLIVLLLLGLSHPSRAQLEHLVRLPPYPSVPAQLILAADAGLMVEPSPIAIQGSSGNLVA